MNRLTPNVCILRSRLVHASLPSPTDVGISGDRDEEDEVEPDLDSEDSDATASESKMAGVKYESKGAEIAPAVFACTGSGPGGEEVETANGFVRATPAQPSVDFGTG